ncbi:unnamed protein product [Orchesella dallaii]|uniref:Uncharacterized protein n=1 Tax=Orchesella dallaii TaxID=48710 RepID=A0ABP1PTN4_9HEXA
MYFTVWCRCFVAPPVVTTSWGGRTKESSKFRTGDDAGPESRAAVKERCFIKLAEAKLGVKKPDDKQTQKSCEYNDDDDEYEENTNDENDRGLVVDEEDEEPDWDAEELKIENSGPSDDDVNISPERETEVFRKPKVRVQTVSANAAFVGIIPLVKWGCKYATEEKCINIYSTCAMDSAIQMLLGLYIHHPPCFILFLKQNCKTDLTASEVQELMSNGMEYGFGKLLGWQTVSRFMMCLNLECENYVDIQGNEYLSSLLVEVEVGDVFLVADYYPEKIIRKFNDITTRAIHCKSCNMRFRQKFRIITTPGFMFFPLLLNLATCLKENLLPKTYIIRGESFKVFGHIVIRGSLFQKNNTTPLPHFYTVVVNKNKRIVFDGLERQPYVQNSSYEGGNVTEVWLVSE